MGFLENLKGILDGKKQSLILDNSYSTAAALLFEKMVNEKVGFNVKVFSTEEAALVWLAL